MIPVPNLADLFMGSVTVGERGQVVIPAAARERCSIEPGDKLLSFIHPSGTSVMFIKVDAISQLTDQLRQIEAVAQGATESSSEGAAK